MTHESSPTGPGIESYRPGLRRYLGFQQLVLEISVVIMALLVAAEVFCRSILGFSLHVTEEIGGYLLVVVVFLGMPLTLAEGTLFRVEFVMGRLSARAAAGLMVIFNIMSLLVAALLDWQLAGLVRESWERGIVAPTVLATPQYLPQLVMVVGMTSVMIVLLVQIVRGVKLFFAGEGDE